MSLFDDIQSLESAVMEILDKETYGSIENFREAYVDGIINSLGDFTAEDISTIDIDAVVNQALQDTADFIDDDLAAEIENDVNTIVSDTTDFYSEQGIDMPNLLEAVERREAVQKLTEEFTNNMGSMRDELLDQTITAIENQVTAGNISRSGLMDEILEAADGNLHYAKTNARMVVSGYNRIGRDEVRREAGLDHGYYYGEIRDTTRAFCRKCVGQVFNMDQIKLMSNGQGLDVIIYCGGWNCIHSWLWMEPDWDPELKERFDAERSVVDLDADGLNLKVPG